MSYLVVGMVPNVSDERSRSVFSCVPCTRLCLQFVSLRTPWGWEVMRVAMCRHFLHRPWTEVQVRTRSAYTNQRKAGPPIFLIVANRGRLINLSTEHLDRAGDAPALLYFSIGTPIRLPHSVHDPS